MQKKKFLSILALLFAAVTGAWAQVSVTLTGNTATFSMPAYDVEVTTELWYKLDDTEDNSSLASKTDVFLERTLSADNWSTFCAPFDADIPTGWTVKQLSSSSFSDGTLTLNFTDASTIAKGTPYLVKATANADGPTFEGVTQDWNTLVTVETDYATFTPVLTPKAIAGEDKTMLYLGAASTLYYPNGSMTINGFRAYFALKGITAGEPAGAGVRAFVMNFGDGEATGILSLTADQPAAAQGTYTLDGRRINGQPTQRGIYIVNGKKVVIK